MKSQMQQTIEQYIAAYNHFDVDGMLTKLHPEVVFKNVSNGEVDLITNGLAEFKDQAQEATAFFSQRKQQITDFKIKDQQAEVWIDYEATLAIDLPNGMKKGEQIALKGRSVFSFENDLIVSITDYS